MRRATASSSPAFSDDAPAEWAKPANYAGKATPDDDAPAEWAKPANYAGKATPDSPAIDTSAYWQAWFDGSALPNPGKMGLGVVLVAPDGLRAEQSVLAGGTGCNNEAELHALCAALETAWQAGARTLLLHGDSDVALRYVRGPDSTRIARLVPLIALARDRMGRFDEVQLVWIPRHRNLDADRLSRQALGLPDVVVRIAMGRRRRR